MSKLLFFVGGRWGDGCACCAVDVCVLNKCIFQDTLRDLRVFGRPQSDLDVDAGGGDRGGGGGMVKSKFFKL